MGSGVAQERPQEGLDLDARRGHGRVEPRREGVPPLVGDAEALAGADGTGRLVLHVDQAQPDQSLGLRVQPAGRRRPEVAEAPVGLRGQLVGGVRTQGQQAEDGVRGGGQLGHPVDTTPVRSNLESAPDGSRSRGGPGPTGPGTGGARRDHEPGDRSHDRRARDRADRRDPAPGGRRAARPLARRRVRPGRRPHGALRGDGARARCRPARGAGPRPRLERERRGRPPRVGLPALHPRPPPGPDAPRGRRRQRR